MQACSVDQGVGLSGPGHIAMGFTVMKPINTRHRVRGKFLTQVLFNGMLRLPH